MASGSWRSGLVQDHGHVGDLVAAMRLRHHRALVRGLNRLQHFHRPETELSEPVRPQAHRHARGAGRRLDVARWHSWTRTSGRWPLPALWHRAASRSSPKMFTTTGAVSPVSVSPMRSPRKVSTSNWMPGNFFSRSLSSSSTFSSSLPAMGLSSTWNSLRCGPHGSSPSSARPTCCSTVAMCSFWSKSSRDLGSDSHHFRQGRARRSAHLEHEMAFAEIRQQLSAEERQPGGGADADDRHHADDQPRPAGDEPETPAVAGLQPALEPRFRRLAHALVEEQKRQRRRERQRHQQRGQDGEDVAQGQRGKETALQPGQREHRQEDQDHDERGIDDRAPHFERRPEHHVENGARLRERLVLAEPAEDVLHVNDGIIHHGRPARWPARRA